MPRDEDRDDPFWETLEAVQRFAAREADHRLLELLDSYAEPSRARVLDLGCAAGRNAVVLARRGFDVHAIDGSTAMVEHTRARLVPVLGADEATRRVRVGRMDDLSRFAGRTFDLVVALGVLHQAGTRTEWEATAAEVGRILADRGLLLYAGFSPRSMPDGEPLTPEEGQENVFRGFRAGRHYLLGGRALDGALARFDLVPVEPTREVEVVTERGQRVTVNGLYRRRTRLGSIASAGSAERPALLHLARMAVRCALNGDPPPDIAPALASLLEPRAAFVTVRRRDTGELRGCRGECPAQRPLAECVRRVAVAAALGDPRFPPVDLAELPTLRFEISALTDPRPIRPEEVEVGRHGLLLVSPRGVGLLLPQVPENQGWGRAEFLDGVCFKAGVEPGAWLDEGVTLHAFEAEIWEENGLD